MIAWEYPNRVLSYIYVMWKWAQARVGLFNLCNTSWDLTRDRYPHVYTTLPLSYLLYAISSWDIYKANACPIQSLYYETPGGLKELCAVEHGDPNLWCAAAACIWRGTTNQLSRVEDSSILVGVTISSAGGELSPLRDCVIKCHSEDCQWSFFYRIAGNDTHADQ